MKRRICLISPGHVASNPRLVKEATALWDAGYSVRVVAGDYMAAIRPLDQMLLQQVQWDWQPVRFGSKLTDGWRAIWQKGLRSVSKYQTLPTTLSAWAHHRLWRQLSQVAASVPADLYLAHNLAALPAAARAASQHRARLGFDAEDFHVGELNDTPQTRWEINLRDRIERTFLPQCDHLTAAAPGITEAYRQRYGVTMETLLNVFPRIEAPTVPVQHPIEPGRPIELYWFSQTIGPGRGLESILQAMGQMTTPVKLYLRGHLANGYGDHLQSLTTQQGLSEQLSFLPPAPASDMVKLAARHDLGLSLEETQIPNRNICLTNKIFTYLLGGMPVVLSQTAAQVDLAEELGAAACLVDLRDPVAISTQLDHFLSCPQRFFQAQQTAWNLGQNRFNWDIEKHRFLASIERVLNQK